MPDPAEVWRSLAIKYGSDGSLVTQSYRDLVSRYDEPQRYYHNLGHITALLQLYFQYENQLAQPDIVLFSIFYHDAVYMPGRSDNELQSALLAARALGQMGVPENSIEEVSLYIRATRQHQLPEDADPDLKLFIDFDLSILAADLEAYKEYVLRVRKEYGNLSDEHFTQGRSVFLQYLLQQEHIFYSNSFRAKEEVARKNIKWELQMSPGIYSAR